ncbi:DUF1289 domain-containing protein [Thalassolituus sp. LLYu03]|uniref:DUF1289 domain-containing protein n=1 Tax=Thalassolituus sp. LLYu03 TaxID=3421656 RepID=UPI003D2AEA95
MIDQGELFEIPSPCRRICELNNRGYCKGCFRSRDERLNWLKYSDFQRQMIINLCEKRRLKVMAARQSQDAEPDAGFEEPAIPQFELFSETPSDSISAPLADNPPYSSISLTDTDAANEPNTSTSAEPAAPIASNPASGSSQAEQTLSLFSGDASDAAHQPAKPATPPSPSAEQQASVPEDSNNLKTISGKTAAATEADDGQAARAARTPRAASTKPAKGKDDQLDMFS